MSGKMRRSGSIQSNQSDAIPPSIHGLSDLHTGMHSALSGSTQSLHSLVLEG